MRTYFATAVKDAPARMHTVVVFAGEVEAPDFPTAFGMVLRACEEAGEPDARVTGITEQPVLPGAMSENAGRIVIGRVCA
ncbi:MAG TPA: hypothetical protein VG733_05200 [Chthoniobacteraceae bacterium]|nr:hypothetical protein [Chthoniobacteraceae bacterium]